MRNTRLVSPIATCNTAALYHNSAPAGTIQILARVQNYTDGKSQDDIALLVVKLSRPE